MFAESDFEAGGLSVNFVMDASNYVFSVDGGGGSGMSIVVSIMEDRSLCSNLEIQFCDAALGYFK